MIADLKPYRGMKDSGVEWLGRVPHHWDIRRIKRIARLNPTKSEMADRRAHGELATFLPMNRVGADGRIDVSEVRDVESLWNGFTYFRRADVIVAKITPCFENGKGACLDQLPTDVGFGSTEFHVLRAQEGLLPQFLYRLTTLSDFRRLGTEAMTGAAGQQRVSEAFVKQFEVGLPPAIEQDAIVRYLDHADRRIRRYIRAKQNLTKILEEQKQAVIYRAVTRGLKPDVRLKPSGVAWLGELPEHWQIKRAKYLFREVDRRTTTGEEVLLSLRMFLGLVPHNDVSKIPIGPEALIGFKQVRPGQLVMNRMRAAIGMFGVPKQSGLVSPDYAVFDVSDKVDVNYFLLLFKTRGAGFTFRVESKGLGTGSSGFMRLYTDRFGRIGLPLPSRDEQAEIVDSISNQTSELTGGLARVRAEIALASEYRTRLVADVITGKFDVRDIVAALPNEPDVDRSQLDDSLEESDELEGADEEIEA